MDIINKIEKKYYSNNMLTDESWTYLIGLLSKSINENKEEWGEFFFESLVTFLSYKYFTKSNQYLNDKNQIENKLKVKVKQFYPLLISANDDSKLFLSKVNNLPIELKFLIAKHCLNLSENLKKSVVISKKLLKEHIKNIKSLRKKIANDINNISLKYENLLNIQEVVVLYNNGALFEDNFINQGIVNFLHNLLEKDEKTDEISNLGILSKAQILDMKNNIKSFSSYNGLIKGKRDYFDNLGNQIGKRFQDAIEFNVDGENYDYVIDTKSIYKEPYMLIYQQPFEEGGVAETDFEEVGGGMTNNASVNTAGGEFDNTADIDIPDMGGDFESDIGEDDNENNNENDNELPEEFGT